MSHGGPVAAAARLRALRERRGASDLVPDSVDAPTEVELREAEEALEGWLRPDAVAGHAQAAATAPGGREGESLRRAARSLVGPFLDRASRSEDEEIAARSTRAQGARDDFETLLVFEEDPAERGRLLAARAALDHSLETVRASRAVARDDAARKAGRSRAFDLAACAEPRDPTGLLDEVERGARGELDEAIGRALRAGSEIREFRSRFGRAGVASVLRRLGAGLGEDPDARGPLLARGRGIGDRAFAPPGERAVVVLGSAGGPGGLRAALEAFGRAARGGAVGRLRGREAAAAADPAFEEAAARLFARLVLSAPFRAWAGVADDPSMPTALRLEEARTVASAWERLGRAARGVAHGEPHGGADEGSIETRGAAGLRGAMLAALVEERLMTRHGRTWFTAPEAGRLLHEIWDAEPDETAESVAQTLSLGRMTPDVLVEAYRP